MRTRECITCVHIFKCKGKENDSPCVSYVKREKKDGGKKK